MMMTLMISNGRYLTVSDGSMADDVQFDFGSLWQVFVSEWRRRIRAHAFTSVCMYSAAQ